MWKRLILQKISENNYREAYLYLLIALDHIDKQKIPEFITFFRTIHNQSSIPRASL